MGIKPLSLCAAAAASLLAAIAPAHALTLSFSGSGVVTGPAQTPPVFTGLTIAPPDASYTFGAEVGWTLDVVFGGALTDSGGYAGAMSGQFRGPVGGDALFFVGTQAATLLGEPIALAYTVTGGSGAFAGYAGSGSSTVILMGNPLGLPTPVPFIELGGVLNLAPVPEPGTLALWLAGLTLTGVATLRRPQARGSLVAPQGALA